MKKILLVVSILIVVTGFAQNNTKNRLEEGQKWANQNLITKEYRNKFILKNACGEMFKIDSTTDYKIVFVKWDNGYYSIGQLKLGYADGLWKTYDKKNRLRKIARLTSEGQYVLTLVKLDKRGRLIKRAITCSTPPF